MKNYPSEWFIKISHPVCEKKIMSILEIVYYPHPVLRKKAAPVTEFDTALTHLLADMTETMYAAKGVGLAAPQVAISKRIAVIDVTEERNAPFCIINPEIIDSEGLEKMAAGCLSLPNTHESVPRFTRVKVRAQNEKGEFFEIEGTELLGHCLQHEMDHLNGILYIDHLSPLKRQIQIRKMEKFLRQQTGSETKK
jgi:peptide deformylase